jgi:hypothetical protein
MILRHYENANELSPLKRLVNVRKHLRHGITTYSGKCTGGPGFLVINLSVDLYPLPDNWRILCS